MKLRLLVFDGAAGQNAEPDNKKTEHDAAHDVEDGDQHIASFELRKVSYSKAEKVV